jgi:hypothetical protein
MCRIFTASELQHRTYQELSVLFRKVSEKRVQSEPGSEAQRVALASRENIARTMTVRRSLRFKPPGF